MPCTRVALNRRLRRDRCHVASTTHGDGYGVGDEGRFETALRSLSARFYQENLKMGTTERLGSLWRGSSTLHRSGTAAQLLYVVPPK